MSSYKLTYFNERARAEVSRVIFAIAGQRFQDVRIEESEWLGFKSQMPLGQMSVKDNLEQAEVEGLLKKFQEEELPDHI